MFEYLKNTIQKFPLQIKEALDVAGNFSLEGNFENVVICGMGASSVLGDFFKEYFNISIAVSNTYSLPKTTSANSLIIISSSSGETEETLTNLKQAIDLGLKNSIVATGFGGKLEEICQKIKIPFLKINKPYPEMQARWSYGYNFTIIGSIIANTFNITTFKKELEDVINRFDVNAQKEEAFFIADQARDKHMVFHGPEKLWVLAKIMRIEVGEDTKRPAFFNNFSEVNHYESVSFSKYGEDFVIAILQDPSDSKRIMERQSVTQDLMNKCGTKTFTIKLKANTQIEKLFYSILFGMWLGYKLCEYYNENPSKLELVSELKEKISHSNATKNISKKY